MNEQKQPLRKVCSAKIDILQSSFSTEYQANCFIKVFQKTSEEIQ